MVRRRSRNKETHKNNNAVSDSNANRTGIGIVTGIRILFETITRTKIEFGTSIRIVLMFIVCI